MYVALGNDEVATISYIQNVLQVLASIAFQSTVHLFIVIFVASWLFYKAGQHSYN